MMRLALLCVVLTALGAAMLSAQNLVVRVVGRDYEEYADGMLGNLLLRTPVFSRPWRQPVVRALVFLSASAFYETTLDPGAGHPGHPGWQDWRDRAVGYLGTELVLYWVQHVVRR